MFPLHVLWALSLAQGSRDTGVENSETWVSRGVVGAGGRSLSVTVCGIRRLRMEALLLMNVTVSNHLTQGGGGDPHLPDLLLWPHPYG